MGEKPNTGQQQPANYQIQIQGQIGPRWLNWFDDLASTVDTSDDGATITTLTGPVVDQAGLRGILNRIWDLNLTLLSVTRTDRPSPGHQQTSNSVSQQCSDSVLQ
ncbi:MAG: hypothetical protein PVF77_12530 [Anaerolineae bacterium]|jgi:hypothetical protein